MKKKDKSRILILKGLTLHLKGMPLKKIDNFYNLYFHENSFREVDISFTNYLTNNTIRNRGIIEAILKQYVKKKLPKNFIEVKAAIMLGISQILFSKTPLYASVNSTVDLFEGKIKKWRNFANAVLRNICRDREKLEKSKNDLRNILPEWIYSDWNRQFGLKNTHKLAELYKEEPSLDIRVKNNINFWVKELNGEKLGKNTVRIFNRGKIENLKGYTKGLWWVQDIASQIPVNLMGNIKNKTILDLCASPGGKTAQMLNEGAIVKAIDISTQRVEKLKNNIDRIGLCKNFQAEVLDIMSINLKAKFDVVLLDAPCTGTGTFRKNPDVLWIKSKKDVIKNSIKQKKMLIKALKFVKENGILIYSNCSLQFEEGEKIINNLIKNKTIVLDKVLRNEIIDYPKEIINKGLIRTLPYMYNGGMDGFFIARIKKLKKYE